MPLPHRSYLAPIVADLAAQQPPITRAQGTFAIVICPTRELCLQVADVLTMLVRRFVWLVRMQMRADPCCLLSLLSLLCLLLAFLPAARRLGAGW